MRWLIFPLWVAVTVVMLTIVVSNSMFAKERDGKLGARVLLCFVWPVALLSKAGRNFLFNKSEGL